MVSILVNNNTCKTLGLMIPLKSKASYSGEKKAEVTYKPFRNKAIYSIHQYTPAKSIVAN